MQYSTTTRGNWDRFCDNAKARAASSTSNDVPDFMKSTRPARANAGDDKTSFGSTIDKSLAEASLRAEALHGRINPGFVNDGSAHFMTSSQSQFSQDNWLLEGPQSEGFKPKVSCRNLRRSGLLPCSPKLRLLAPRTQGYFTVYMREAIKKHVKLEATGHKMPMRLDRWPPSMASR